MRCGGGAVAGCFKHGNVLSNSKSKVKMKTEMSQLYLYKLNGRDLKI